MDQKKLIKRARRFAKPFRISDGEGFRLRDIDPGDTLDLGSEDKPRAQEALAMGVEVLAELQDMLYAQDRWAVLLIFQAMDAAGKDGTIKHVMSGVNPQGCQVFSFKAPSAEDLDHDFLWRCMKCLPERGRIGIFNRSYYEETLVVRVHPEFLAKQTLPPELVGKDIWKNRFQDIRSFERYLGRNGIVIRKFFLHVSKEEQKRRFLERLENPEKNWKFSANDIKERAFWDDYMAAYEDMIRQTASQGRAVVRGARGQQVVHPRGGGRRGDRRAVLARPALPEGRRGEAEGARLGQTRAAAREVAPRLRQRDYCWCCLIASSIFAFTASRLKLAPFCIGGKSIAVMASFATSCWTNTKRQNSYLNQPKYSCEPYLDPLSGQPVRSNGSRRRLVRYGTSTWVFSPSQPAGLVDEAILVVVDAHGAERALAEVEDLVAGRRTLAGDHVHLVVAVEMVLVGPVAHRLPLAAARR